MLTSTWLEEGKGVEADGESWEMEEMLAVL